MKKKEIIIIILFYFFVWNIRNEVIDILATTGARNL